jgi:hypothetical protein
MKPTDDREDCSCVAGRSRRKPESGMSGIIVEDDGVICRYAVEGKQGENIFVGRVKM